MKKTLFVLILAGLAACSKPDKKTFYMPAEWEPHDAVWFGWEDRYLSFHPVAVDIIKNLTPHVQVKLAASSDSLLAVAKAILSKNGVDTSTITFYNLPDDRYWIRGVRAIFEGQFPGRELVFIDASQLTGWMEESTVQLGSNQIKRIVVTSDQRVSIPAAKYRLNVKK